MLKLEGVENEAKEVHVAGRLWSSYEAEELLFERKIWVKM